LIIDDERLGTSYIPDPCRSVTNLASSLYFSHKLQFRQNGRIYSEKQTYSW